ncbi:MAG TPA: T9SS type A sorting domain-containing protein [Prolixibacteraceae bacterium]
MKLFLNCWFIIGLAVAIVISPFVVHAQLSESGLPESFSLDLKNAAILPSLQLDSVHVQEMRANDQEFKIDNRYGVVEPCDINIREAGIKTEIPGKGTIWQYKVESSDAYSLGLFFKDYYLPPKAKVFIYNASKSQLRGAFTNRNNSQSGHQLPVADFPGKDLIIEYFEPQNAEFAGELVLGGVSQAYMDIKSDIIARIGINCPQGDNWKIEKNSVCMITFHDWRYIYFCTGTLINNVREDQTPYFLTANHCIRNEAMANTLIAYFNYENSACDTYDAAYSHTLSGATFKSGSDYSDFALLLLKEYPPDDYNPFYAGWDANGDDPSSGVCIHHPSGLPKCISIDSFPISSYPERAQWSINGLSTLPNTHWSVELTKGSPEVGSSGSPLFDQNKRVVGQLHGGANFVLLFGKFSESWNHSAAHEMQLAHWLDPDSVTQKRMDGIWRVYPKAKFRAELQEVCPLTPVMFYDETTQRPKDWLWRINPSTYYFANGTDSISQNPQVVFLDEGLYSVSLNTSNRYGSDELTQQNYILSKRQLDVKLVQLGPLNEVCGCDLKAFPVVAKGAAYFDFKLEKAALIETKQKGDTLFMTLNPAANTMNSCDSWLKVVGTNGACIASDSMLIHIKILQNDNLVNATRLHLGRNTGYSNQCATDEKNEAHPYSTGCLTPDSWCPDKKGDYNVVDNSIWFTFIAPSHGKLTINTHGFDNQIAVYETSMDSSKLMGRKIQYIMLAANDDRSNTDNTALIENLALQPGKEYLLQVDGNDGAYGDLVIDLLSQSLEVYPNPSTGRFKLIVSNPDAGMAEVIVSDLNGKRLFARQYPVTLDSNQLDIDLSGYVRGIYLLNVRMNGLNLSKKLVLW